MKRANRSYIPEYVWPITHRCHKKEFPLNLLTIENDGSVGFARGEFMTGDTDQYQLRENPFPFGDPGCGTTFLLENP